MCLVRMSHESGCGPVAVLVFKTSGRGDELRRWVQPPRALVKFFLNPLIAIFSVTVENRVVQCNRRKSPRHSSGFSFVSGEISSKNRRKSRYSYTVSDTYLV